ncbi:MAG: hypothetical protein AAGF29_03035 [Pseudomonadota bacterium]
MGRWIERGIKWAIRIMLIVAVVTVGSVLISAMQLGQDDGQRWQTVDVDDLTPGQGKRVMIDGGPYLVRYLSPAGLRAIQSRADVTTPQPRIASVAVNSGLSFGAFSVVPAASGDPSCELSVETTNDSGTVYVDECTGRRYDLIGRSMTSDAADLPLPNLRVSSGELQIAPPVE